MSSNSRLWSGSIADEIAAVFLLKIEESINYDPRIPDAYKLDTKDNIVGQYRSPEGYLIRIEKGENGRYLYKNPNNSPFELSYEKDNLYSYNLDPKVKLGLFEDEIIRFYPSGKTSMYKKETYKKPSYADLKKNEGKYYNAEIDKSFSIKKGDDEQLYLTIKGRINERVKEVEVLNRNELLAEDYILKLK